MPSEMVERVARALWLAREQQYPKFTRRASDDLDQATGAWQMVEAEARAAIEAMREPTQQMLQAGVSGAFDREVGMGDFELEVAWQAMISAALTEGPTT